MGPRERAIIAAAIITAVGAILAAFIYGVLPKLLTVQATTTTSVSVGAPTSNPVPTPTATPTPIPTPVYASSFPTDPASAANYLGITTNDASFRAIPDGAGPSNLIGWQISANRDVTVSIGGGICIDFVKDPNHTHVTSGTFTDLSPTRIRSISKVQIFVPGGYQLSFYRTPC